MGRPRGSEGKGWERKGRGDGWCRRLAGKSKIGVISEKRESRGSEGKWEKKWVIERFGEDGKGRKYQGVSI